MMDHPDSARRRGRRAAHLLFAAYLGLLILVYVVARPFHVEYGNLHGNSTTNALKWWGLLGMCVAFAVALCLSLGLPAEGKRELWLWGVLYIPLAIVIWFAFGVLVWLGVW